MGKEVPLASQPATVPAFVLNTTASLLPPQSTEMPGLLLSPSHCLPPPSHPTMLSLVYTLVSLRTGHLKYQVR